MADTKAVKTAERKERLAAQLRENLKKRKAQARARQATHGPNLEDGEPSVGLAPGKPVG